VFTPREGGETAGGSYRLDERLHLPAEFRGELGSVLAGVAAASVAPHLNSGRFVAGALGPMAEKLRPIVTQPPSGWDERIRGALFHASALMWSVIGEQSGAKGALVEAAALYRKALKDRARERAPLDWATTQNNLGNVLSTLGERESGTARLEQAVEAFDACLMVTAPVWPSEWVSFVRGRRDQTQAEITQRMTK